MVAEPERAVDHGIGKAPSVVVDADDGLADRCPISERDQSTAAIDTAVGDEAGGEPLVDRSDVPHRRPYVVDARSEPQFVVDRPHHAATRQTLDRRAAAAPNSFEPIVTPPMRTAISASSSRNLCTGNGSDVTCKSQ